MEYYLALKRNELSSHEKTRRKQIPIIPSERNQPENVTYYMISIAGYFRKGKTMETIKKSVVAMGEARGRNGHAEHRGFSGQ